MPTPTLRDMLPPSPEELQQQMIGDNQFYRGVVTGAKGITSGSFANDALNAESAGAANYTQLRDTALQRQQEAQAYAPRVGSLRNITGVGDAVDYGLSTLGQGLVSMAPTIAAAAATRAPIFGPAVARATSYAGAAGAGYLQEKGESALGQYSDPTLAAAPVADRQRAATTKGLVNAAMEGIVPAGLTSLAGKNTFGNIIKKDFMTEGATEAVQQYVGHLADKSLDPTRQLDPWDIADAFAGGAITGGAVGVGHGALHKLASAPQNFVTSTREAIDEAGANAPSPTDFLKSVFKPAPSVDLDPVAAGDNHPDLVDAVTKAGEQAGEVLDSFTAKRGEMAASYADELLQDPATPAAVKQTVLDMNGDYESPQNQAALGATYVGRKASEVASQAKDFIKGLAPKAAEAAKGFVNGAKDRVVKKNLQGGPLTEDEIFALHKDIIDNLKPEAKRRTDVIADMPQLAAGIAGVINKYGAARTAPTDKNIQELQHLYSATSTLFDNPEAVFAKLASKVESAREGAKKATPFSDLLAGVTTAQQDVGKNEGSSYLQTRLVAPMGQAQIAKLAEFVDQFGMTDYTDTKKADKVLDGLAVAFGGKQEALQVLDYYSKANRLNAKQLLQYDANTQLDAEDGRVLSADDIQDNPDDFNSGIREYEAKPTKSYSFADPKTLRPFFRPERLAKHDAASMRQGTVASDSAKVTTIPYDQYADETGKDHKAEMTRIMNDVKGRQKAAFVGYATELGIKGTDEQKAVAGAKAAMERRKSPDKDSTRLANIDALQGQLDMAREAYKQGGPKGVLGLYEVGAAEQNEKDNLTATDEEIKSMAPNKRENPKGATPEQRKELAQKVKDDTVAFTSPEGKKLTLSAEKMVLAQARKEKATGEAARGEGGVVREARLLKEAIASVVARGYSLETRTINASEGAAERASMLTPGENTRTEPTGLPTLKRFPRSDDTKAALKEREPSIALLQRKVNALVREYEANTKENTRDVVREGIERNVARLQSQFEQYDGKHYEPDTYAPKTLEKIPGALIPKSAPQQAVIRQRQAVYKEALAAINDIDFQERVDGREKDGPDMAVERTENTGARVSEEDTGEQLAARGDLKKTPTKRSTTPAAPDTPKTQAQIEREAERVKEQKKRVFEKLKAGTPIGEDRVTKNSFVGAKSNADSDFAAMLNADRALNDPKHVVDTFNRIVKATVGDIVKVITGGDGIGMGVAAEFDFDKAGKPFIRAIAGMFDSALTPEVAAHHEAAHVVVQIVQQTEGKAAAKRMVDLANQDYIRKQVSEKMGITASYFLNSPEELFVQAYALWATGGLKLNSEPVLTKVFRAIKSFFAGMTQDEGLASAFHAIRNGEFANSGVELNHASLENRLHKSKHDFFSYGGGKPSRADVNKVLKALNLTSKDVDMQKIYDDKEAFAVLVALSTMAEADITNEEAAEIKGILTEYGIAPKSKGAGTISDKLIDAVADVVLKENYARITTPEKALAFARAAKQVLGHLQAITPVQWGAIDAKDEDHYDKLQSLKNQLEGNFDQSGHASFDWQSLFDGEGTKADEAEMDRIVKSSKQDARTELGSTTPKDQQEALDEILRIRGKDVQVAFEAMAAIGGSGEFSMNKDKTKRLIRLAIDGANMKSTAWHESLHDFIAMLGGTPEERKLKRDMFNATNTPYINAKLRELLKNHPAALKQLSDPEERLAYVYQFWAEGALQLKGNADTLMQKIADFIQKLLGIVSQDGKLDAQLAALHSGALTEPSTVARVLDDLDAKTVRDKLESLAGPLADGLSRVFTTATDRLRKPGVDSLDKLASLFHKDPGHESGAGGMLQRRAQKEGQFSNAFQKIVEGTTAAERLNALSNLQAMRTPTGPIELGLTKLLDDMFGYMTEAGVATFNKNTKKWDPVRRVANYFPRSWDAESIRKDLPGFKALLAANGVSQEQQDAITNLLTKGGSDQLDLMENEKSLGFVPLAVHVNDRMLTFIGKQNAHLFAKYQNKDVTDIMTTYIRQASHRAEYTRSFGNNGEVIEDLLKEAREQGMTHAEEEAVLPTIRGLEGTLGHDMNPELKKLMSGVITMENVLLMPMAIFSQMVDPIGIAMRTNSIKDAGEAYLQSLKDLRKVITRDKSYDYDRELTKMLGIISTDSMLETMGQTQGSMYMSSTVRNINKQFFRYNGMEGWNNSMRVAATVAGERYLIANIANERAMTELNVDPKNIKVMPKGTNWGEAGRMAITKEQFEHLGMTKPEAQAAAEQIQEAMFRFVDGAVVRPNAAHRATWMSDPRFQLLSHLKQFTFSFQAAVLNRARNEYIHGNSTPMLLLSMTVPIMLASDIAKWAVTGTMPANWTALDYMTHAVVRSGILGKYEYAARSVEDAARGNIPGLSFAGPTVEHANILAQWIAGAPGASSDRVINRSIPLARYA